MDERTPSAILAAIAGFTLGAPRVGKREFAKLSGYEPIPRRMAASPLIDAWLVWRTVAESTPPGRLSEALLANLPDESDETAFALANLRRGIVAPASGSIDNPLAEGPRALLRSAYWGLIFGGDADTAHRYAKADAEIDHTLDGVAIPAALAAAIASRPLDARALWGELSARLPDSSRLHAFGPHLLQNSGRVEAMQEFTGQFSRLWPDVDPLGAVATAARTLMALLSADDTWSAMKLAAGSGGASDISTALTGLVGTLLCGPIAAEHLEPLGQDYVASHALRLDPPATIAEFAELCASPVMVAIAGVEPESASEDRDLDVKAEWRLLGPIAAPVAFPTPPERIGGHPIDFLETYSSRSGHPIRWVVADSSTVFVDIEPRLLGGMGTVYIAAKLKWQQAIPTTLWVRVIGDMHAWVDGKLALRLNDADARFGPPDSAEIAEIKPGNEHEVVIKVVRTTKPIPPVVIAFFDESGRVVHPDWFLA